MYALALLQGMVFYGAVATLYRQAAGVTVFQITIIESISLALALALELPWGIIADKIGYRNTMILCSGIYVLSKIVFWRADGFAMFLVERILLAVVIAGLSGVDTSVLYLSSKEAYAQKAFSIYGSLGTFGMIFAAGVYSLFFNGNYRLAALATVVAYGIAAILSCFLKEVRPETTREAQPLKEFIVVLKSTFGRKELLLFLIGVGLFTECHQTITVFLNQLQYVRAGMSNQMIGVVFAIVTITGLVGAKSAALTGWLGKRKTGTLLFAAATLACVTLTITVNPWLSVAGIIILRVVYSLLMPIVQTYQHEMVTHQNRATVISLNSIIMDGVAIGTNLIFGKVSDTNLPGALGIGALFCLIGMILFYYGTSKSGEKGLAT